MLLGMGRRAGVQLTSLSVLARSCMRGFATTHIGTSSPSPTKLDEIMKVDALMDKTPEEVEEIWMKVCGCWAHLRGACVV